MYRNLLRACVPTLLAFLLGCTYTDTGIFYTIEKEVFIPNASDNLKNDITVNGLARLGTTTYVGSRSLFKKADTDSDWSVVAPAEWGTGFGYVLSVAGSTGRIFVVVSDGNATQTKLMHFDGSSWAQSTGTMAGKPVRLTPILDATGGVAGIYLSVHKADGAYDVHDLNLGTGAINAALNLGSETLGRSVVAAATNGTHFFLTSGDGRLFRGTSINSLTKLPTSFGADLGGVSALNTFPVASANVFVTLSNGRVAWSSDGGTTWTQSASFSRQGGENPVVLGPIFSLHGVTVAGSTVAGKQGGGYYEIVSDGSGGAKLQNPTEATTVVNNYTSTALANATVTATLTLADHTLVGTLGKGLFRQTHSNKSWTWE